MKWYLACFLLVSISACAGNPAISGTTCSNRAPVTGDDSNVLENDLGLIISWDREQFPLRLNISNSVRISKRELIIRAANTWNTAVGRTVFITSVQQENSDNVDGTIWVTETELPRSDCSSQVLGLTTWHFFYDEFGIERSIRSVNIEFHRRSSVRNFFNTAVHELGHALGLRHDREPQSIMFPYNTEERHIITEEDLEFVRSMLP